MDQIIFVSHPIYTDYEASRCGIIRHKRLKKNLGWISNMGYMEIGINVNGKKKHYQSSRLFMSVFMV